MKDTTDRRPILGRLAWFVGLWAAGVATVASLGAVLRPWLL